MVRSSDRGLRGVGGVEVLLVLNYVEGFFWGLVYSILRWFGRIRSVVFFYR